MTRAAMAPRVASFVGVAGLGFVVQLAAIAVLSARLPYPLATALAVELAILHNFVWHERWTWPDHGDASRWWERLARFNGATGVVSIGGNILITAAGVELLQLPVALANAVAVGSLGALNFLVADRWIWRDQGGNGEAQTSVSSVRSVTKSIA